MLGEAQFQNNLEVLKGSVNSDGKSAIKLQLIEKAMTLAAETTLMTDGRRRPGWFETASTVLDAARSSQVKLLITNNAFCIVQRATAQSKTGIFHDCCVAEAPPGFQAGWSDCMHFLSLFLLILLAHLEIMQPRHWSP
jgi:ectoine hydroxylase-related dioxygenase (phytanoyl-CoA dioxygenase family)